VHTGLWWGKLRERHLLEDLGIDGKILVYTYKRIVKEIERGIDWIDLAQDTDR
jgi:hypothetical protein